jgi:hypothetical protein
VHRVRGQDQELGPGALDSLRSLGEILRRLVPVLVADEAFDHAEVHAIEHKLRSAVAALARVDALVEAPVVLGAGNAAHATQNTDRPHRVVLLASPGLQELAGTSGTPLRLAQRSCIPHAEP